MWTWGCCTSGSTSISTSTLQRSVFYWYGYRTLHDNKPGRCGHETAVHQDQPPSQHQPCWGQCFTVIVMELLLHDNQPGRCGHEAAVHQDQPPSQHQPCRGQCFTGMVTELYMIINPDDVDMRLLYIRINLHLNINLAEVSVLLVSLHPGTLRDYKLWAELLKIVGSIGFSDKKLFGPTGHHSTFHCLVW